MLALSLRDDPSIALATDLYELSMALGFWKNEVTTKQAAFHMFYRTNPFDGGYVVWAGLQDVIEALQNFRFSRTDLDYLASLRGRNGGRLFEDAFLAYLGDFRFSCDVNAVPEGTVVFPNEPLIEVRGPILQAQVVETIILNTVNFQSLIATKAARVACAAQGEPVVDFGLRRAPGLDGGFSASRASYIGGCVGTSNVLAGKRLGIQVLGTFAHSWVMSFDSELEAFEAFGRAMPNNCVYLVDTYGSLNGVKNAITAALQLRERGHEMVGIRLDSGDLAWLSIQARKMLDEAGFPEALIMGSSDLDEWLIRSLKTQGAKINAWGVGTRMVTGNGDPALGGVYKLSAVRDSPDAEWRYKLKLSEIKAKISIPGLLQVYRCSDAEGKFVADAIVDTREDASQVQRIIDPNDNTKTKRLKGCASTEPLLQPIFKDGRPVYTSPPLDQIRRRTQSQLERLDPAHRRFENPHIYPVGLSPAVNQARDGMIAEARTALEPANNGGK